MTTAAPSPTHETQVSAQHFPSRISVTKDRRALVITWRDGLERHLSSSFLRKNCQSAPSKRETIYGEQPLGNDEDGPTITDIQCVGLYGINIVFSDGHDRGIYPWPFLHELSWR